MSRYVDEPPSEKKPAEKTAILLINLGTPDAPTTSAVRRYLREFLSDPRVVEIPRAIWWAILNGIILTVRPKKSAWAGREIDPDKASANASLTGVFMMGRAEGKKLR